MEDKGIIKDGETIIIHLGFGNSKLHKVSKEGSFNNKHGLFKDAGDIGKEYGSIIFTSTP